MIFGNKQNNTIFQTLLKHIHSILHFPHRWYLSQKYIWSDRESSGCTQYDLNCMSNQSVSYDKCPSYKFPFELLTLRNSSRSC